MHKICLHLILAACVFGLMAGCFLFPDDNGGMIDLDPEPVKVPGWVQSATHPRYPNHDYFFVTLSGGENPPHRVAVEHALYRVLHGKIRASLENQLPNFLSVAASNGRWVSRFHVPQEAVIFSDWSDGFQSAAYIALKRSVLRGHNIQQLPKARTKFESSRKSPTSFGSALDDLTWRALAAEDALQLLASAALAENELDPEWVSETLKRARYLVAFEEDVRVEIGGGDARVALGVRPTQAIALKAVYRGKPATNLPLKPLLAGQDAIAPRQTDARGIARIEFAKGLRYTGMAVNHLGFAMYPDLLVPGVETGLELKPWTTTLTLPAKDNVVVYMNLIEKFEGRIIAGPVTKALRALLKDAGIPVIDQRPDNDEKRFVLKIEGVLACHEFKPQNGRHVHQVHSKGAIILKSFPVPALASVKFSGISDVLDDDAQGSALDALQEGWNLIRSHTIEEFRAAFPPLFLPEQ